MIEELYRTLIDSKINPNPDTLRMYMRGEKTLDELKNEHPFPFNEIIEERIPDSHNPFRSLNLAYYDENTVPDSVSDAYNRLREKYDFSNGRPTDYQDALHDDKDDVETVQSFLRGQNSSYKYDPDKDYYAIKAYKKGSNHTLRPYYMAVENEDIDVHRLGNSVEHDGSGERGGFSVNGLARAYGRDEVPPNHINRILYNINDPRLKKELLEKELRTFTEPLTMRDTIAITKSKGKDILPTSSTNLINDGLDPLRDSPEESVVKGLTPVEEIKLRKEMLSYYTIKDAADELGMSVHDFVHSKHIIPFIKENGLKLDDIKKLSDMEDKEFFVSNNRSNARKVMERLMSRGYDNIVSDEGLKIKERFL